MLFYLTSKDKVNLLDFVEGQIGLIPKKMTGRFSLMQFVVRDMRNYAHIRYFTIDRAAIMEDNDGFIEAVKSFQIMYSARIVVVCEGYGEQDAFIRQLVAAGVTDIVTAVEVSGIQAEVMECLSPEGMLRFKVPQVEQAAAPAIQVKSGPVVEQFTFNAKNIRIAVAGAQRRVGTTVTAANFAHWIQAHGGTACYVESNMHKHLAYIVKLYGEALEGNHYGIGGVDYYFTDELDRSYNFIITDCGELGAEPQATFTGADLRLLCGSAMPYELPKLQDAVGRCAGHAVQAVGVGVPQDIQPLVESIDEGMVFAEPSHELFDATANHELYKKVVEKYIGGPA